VSGGGDNTVRFWDARSGKPLGGPLYGHTKPVTALAFGEIDELPVLVSVDESNTMLLWDVRDRIRPLTEPWMTAGNQVTAAILFDLDGIPVIATSSGDHNVRLWDTRHRSQVMWTEYDVPVLVGFEPTEKVVQAAKEGDADAQLQVYWDTPSPDRLEWLCRSADQGLPEARYRLGLLYEHGRESLPKDYVKAYQWYKLSENSVGDWAGGASGAAAQRMARNLTPEQLAEGVRLVTEWRPGQCVIEYEVAKKKRLSKKKCPQKWY
jgi:hypothetical protein